MSGGNPCRRSMRRRGAGATHSSSPGDGGAPLAGTTTCRQELADRRGWSTFSEARPVSRETRRTWSAGRRVPPIARRNGVIARRPARMVSPAIHRGFRRPPRLPALRSPRGSAMRRRTRACPGPTSRIRAAERWLARRSFAEAGCLTIESERRSARATPPGVMRGHSPSKTGVNALVTRASMMRRSEPNQYWCACGPTSWIAGSSPAMTVWKLTPPSCPRAAPRRDRRPRATRAASATPPARSPIRGW